MDGGLTSRYGSATDTRELATVALVIWLVILAFIVGLLVISWSFDRSAKKRGATPRSSTAAVNDIRDNRRTTLQRESQQLTGGMTPRAQDAMNKTWKRHEPKQPD
jgi:hypothetical protein